ncbi:putative RNA-directed DNA polymerase [Tanacetum coccineum]
MKAIIINSNKSKILWVARLTFRPNSYLHSVDRYFVGVVGSWVGSSNPIGLLNVYAPQASHLKECLWSSIATLINSVNATWVVFGDFNVVRSQDERSGCYFDSSEAGVFNDFISRTGLFDLPLGGRRFTRFDKDGRKASKLDRFLVSSNFFDVWNDASVSVLCRSFSDHCPLLIKVDPSPAITPDIGLKNKLKKLRMAIKKWTFERLAAQNKDREDLSKNLLEWDIKAENGLINEADIIKREEWLMDLNQLDQHVRDDLRQKCRVKWAVEGDENTRFFRSLFKGKNANSSIKGMLINGIWEDNPDVIKNAAIEHFSSRFKESGLIRPSFSNNLFRKLSEVDAKFLESGFSLEEVKEAVWNCAGSKAPGPDGYNFNFIKSFWDVIKLDFWNCVKYFESSGKLAKGCNPSFVSLIPKKNDPLSFSDYRPISLIGCIYKVIAKILASRLAKVIGSVIRSNQSAFIEGRQILDGCLVANEIIRTASIENTKLLLFKVDFKRAFDSVNWNFLLDVMRQMGFGSKWRTWIASCLSSASISVMINGSPSNEFKMERGLRQGDPLSPFLFLIVAEALQVCILDACNKGLYNGVSLARCGANVSLLQYADDALLFGEWSRRNVVNLVHILKCFEMGSGLKVNISKSRILGVGVSEAEIEAVASSIGCAPGTFPFSYLGLPVGKKMHLKEGWNAIIDRFRDKLSNWKAKNLSIGGRLTLVKSVLSSLPIYYLSLFKAPISIINSLEAIRCRFFWGCFESQRGIYWVKWNSILLDHKFGGLGIGSLLAKNYGLLCKWKWRFLSEEEALWRMWCEDERKLADAFPRLYALESFKDCRISDRWHMVNDSGVGNWSWIRPLRGRANDDLASFVSYIGRLHLNADGADKWVWSFDTSGSFKKVNICVWRASLNRLPTRVNLDLRGINMASNICPFCNTCVEDIEHCLINCSHSLAIWRKIWSWWNMPSPLSFPSFSIRDIALGNIGLNGSSRISKVVHGVFLTVVWSIWNWRNRIVNAQPDAIAKIKGEDIFPSIQRLSMTWIAARLASLPANWNSWVAKPFELFS